MIRFWVVGFVFLGMYNQSVSGLEVNIDGLKNSALENNISNHLLAVSLPSDCSINADFSARVSDKIDVAAQALGFYNVDVSSMKIDSSLDCESLNLRLTQGQRVLLFDINISVVGDAKDDLEFTKYLQSMPLKNKQPLIHAQYEAVKSSLESLALNRGYFDSRFVTKEISVDVDNNRANVTLIYDSGKRYMFGDLMIPDDVVARHLISDVVPFESGDFYLASLLGEFNQKLNQTGYFKQVIARPLVSKAQYHLIPIEILAVNNAKDIFNVGVGASTDTGPRATFNWTRPWVNRYGHSLETELYVSAPEQNASVRYKIPLANPLDDFLSIQMGLESLDENDSNSDTFTVAVQRHWTNPDKEWNRIASIRYEQSQFTQGQQAQTSTKLLLPGFTLSRHRSRGGLDINWGDRQQFSIEAASSDLISDINLTRITVLTKWLRSFGDHRVLVRAEVGALSTDDFSRVPSNLRYFAGGDQSVRGFAYESLAPREPSIDEQEGKLIGAKYLNVASIEYSYPVADDWRAIVFTDIGGASDSPGETLAYGAGLGASWLSPVGPIRIYFAHGRGDYGISNQIHFSMGPAL